MASVGRESSDQVKQVAAVETQLARQGFHFRLMLAAASVLLVVGIPLLVFVVLGAGDVSQRHLVSSLGVVALLLAVNVAALIIQRGMMIDSEGELRKAKAEQRGIPSSSGLTGPQNRDSMVAVARQRYHAEAADYIEEARNRAARQRRSYRSAQMATAVGAIIVTTLTGALAGVHPLSWITMAISLLVAVSAALGTIFRWREQGFNLQQTANAIEKEFNNLELRIGDYGEERDPFKKFATKVEELKEEQRSRELQLELSPEKSEAHQGQYSSAGHALPPAGA